MKLTKIAIGVVAVIGAVAVGGSWYTGQQVETRYQEFVQQGNNGLKQLAAYGVIAEIKDVQFQRSLFSSEVKYVLEAEVNGAVYQFKGDDKLFHGPLPLNRLSKGNVLPVLASVESKIQIPENLREHFNNQTYLGSGQSDIRYSGSMKGEYQLNPLKLADGSLTLSASTYAYEYDVNTKNTKLGIKIENASLIDAEELEVVIQDFDYKVDFSTDSKYPLLTLGEYKGSIKSIKMTDSQSSDLILYLNNLNSEGKSKLEKDRVISTTNSDVEMAMQTADHKANFGKINVEAMVETEAQGMNDLTPYLSDLEKLSSAEAEQILLSLLTNAPTVEIKQLNLENETGKNALSLKLDLNKFDPSKTSNFNEVLAMFKDTLLDINLNIKSLETLIAQFIQLQGTSKEEAEQQAKSIVNEISAQAHSSTLAEIDDKSIKMKLAVDQGKLYLNGKALSESEVQGLLFTLVLALGMMGIN